MILEEYVTVETAKLLKQTGFPQDEKYYTTTSAKIGTWAMCYNYVLKPSQSVAMRWLREEYRLYIEIEYTRYNEWEYTLVLDYDTDCSKMVFSVGSPTYEAAAEAGIQAACRYLIEKGGKQ